MMVAALPDATPEEANIKKIFTNECTGCHTPGYPLQFKFDEAGWNKIINLMKVVPGSGVYPGANAKVSQIIEFNRKELAAYLARARGPGETSMKFKDRPRPAGEAARVVWTTYDLPLNPDAGPGTLGIVNPDNDGSDWSMGVTSKLGEMPHDGGMDFDGNVYFTNNNPNKLATIGKVNLWASAPDGAVRFDPVTEQFTDLKSIKPYNSAKGTGMAYGAAGGRDGNGWWAQMALDTIGKGDMTTGKATEVSLPLIKEQ